MNRKTDLHSAQQWILSRCSAETDFSIVSRWICYISIAWWKKLEHISVLQICITNQIYHHVRFSYSGIDCHDKRSRWVGIILRLIHSIRERNCRGTRACRSMHTFGFPRQTHNSCYGFHRTPTFQVRSLLLRSACTVLINCLVNLKGKLI